MVRYAIGGAILILASGAPVAAQVAGPPAAGDAPATGSPTPASSTVSPATIADAMATPATVAPSFNLSIGTTIASGDFGAAEKSRISSTAVGLRYAVGGLRFNASIPYMSIRSRGTIFSGIDSTPVVVGGAAGRKVTNDGFGDATIGASYTLPAPENGVELEFSGRVKLPTATKASKLSTGKTDFSIGAQATKAMGGIAPFISATYRNLGDPRGFDLRNGFAASAGTSIALGDRSVALLSYHYAQAASHFVKDGHELFAGGSTLLPGDRFRLTGFATAGLSNGAAGVSGGISLSLDI